MACIVNTPLLIGPLHCLWMVRCFQSCAVTEEPAVLSVVDGGMVVDLPSQRSIREDEAEGSQVPGQPEPCKEDLFALFGVGKCQHCGSLSGQNSEAADLYMLSLRGYHKTLARCGALFSSRVLRKDPGYHDEITKSFSWGRQ